jgi:hypothetical protein
MGVVREVKEMSQGISEALEKANMKANVYGCIASTLALKTTCELSKLEFIANIESAKPIIATAMGATIITFGYNIVRAHYKFYKYIINEANHNNP